MNGFLKGIKLSNFLDSVAEWHALCQGFFEVICPWPPRKKDMADKLRQEIEAEHHYYMLGRALGILGWLAISCVIKEVFF